MKVKELIKLLSKPELAELEVAVEGCDCIASAAGYSVEGGILYVRQHGGTLEQEMPIVKE